MIITHKIPWHAILDSLGGQEHINGRVVQDPCLVGINCLSNQIMQFFNGVHRAEKNTFDPLQWRLGEYFAGAVDVEVENARGGNTCHDGSRDNRACGSAGNKRKGVTSKLAGCVFKFDQCNGWDNAAYAAAIN